MSPSIVGQRCVSEREPELGLGVVAAVDLEARRISIDFPATGEKRLYALGTPVLSRVQFRAGDKVSARGGSTLVVEFVEEDGGLLAYVGGGLRVPESEVSDATSVSTPPERFIAGQTDPCEVFDLRVKALEARFRFRSSEVRGFLGGRVELIPHQFYIAHEVVGRHLPRVLLADEVGLGKTIEACLIVHRLLATGRARRVLVLVPESLVHQWFVELLRRFNLWFNIYDEGRCAALELSDPGRNPFLSAQLAVASTTFVSANTVRCDQAVAGEWDIVVVDEAHHLAWSPDSVSAEYAMLEQMARRSPGLLLLTATPTQLGLQGHFARLRLLDPNRYHDYDRFVAEAEQYEAVAGIAARVVENKPLTRGDHSALKRVFTRDPARLLEHLEALDKGMPGAREALLRSLLDQHGTGRVVFRNTRAAIKGFPARKFRPAELPARSLSQHVRIARELDAEETGTDAGIRYTFRDDPRIEWLAAFLREHRSDKVLLICRSQRKAVAVDAALQDRVKTRSALFHEGLALVQRDRNAAWFAEADGAQLLICSEIGSEGRNFQFAHHLVLFDLPLNPGLIEQRIGRLDRIGQRQSIRIHVPYVSGSADECVIQWYHLGVDAFETPVQGAEEYEAMFRERLLEVAGAYASDREAGAVRLQQLVSDTVAFREKLVLRMKAGRDRLLELNSLKGDVAERIVSRIRDADSDRHPREFLVGLLDHFGVRVREHEDGDIFLDPTHAFVEGFPSIPTDGMLATFDRKRAIAREDVAFLSPDHPLMRDAIDLLIESPAGTTAFGALEAATPALLLEVVFVLEAIADSRWQVDQFLAPAPIRVVVDAHGNDVTQENDPASLAGYVHDLDIHRFLERSGFSRPALATMIDAAQEAAGVISKTARSAAAQRAGDLLESERQRLRDLQALNDNVRPEEITLAGERLERTLGAIAQARLRLDSLRLIVAGPTG